MKRALHNVAAFLGVVILLAPLAQKAEAQNAIWSLVLTNPNQTVVAGTSGTVVYSGTITNLDSTNVLNLSGDSFSTGTWDPSLSVTEDPAFFNFLLNTGSLNPGDSYSGALLDVTYTSSTPATAMNNPYAGTFTISTDGNPNDQTQNFTLNVKPNASTPEASSFWGLAGLVTVCGCIGLRRQRRRIA
ncbi:hypothetical protein CTKA_01961 [Chthonomonas calidirosea]|uniref:PEP-CTERM protein-sorting domain n=1 Tax=Chthonomonas calidirosea (strain DSM 23976 / ICMP 18418 / T49) TaxID=1303518 RepID=S0EX11_CHTCT|nr:hypothetical protein [Chthonomonas calidirosea]CCW35940.1 hypothetical protein CCALI_02133 [Chthonomonas calidirosea T49]CEK18800.1 hypothetical protein CTKA_01961 [Chthonomonas calidirosea]